MYIIILFSLETMFSFDLLVKHQFNLPSDAILLCNNHRAAIANESVSECCSDILFMDAS